MDLPRYFGSAAWFVALAVATAFPARADETLLTLDPAHSTVVWRLGAVFHTVDGTFALDRGRIAFDPATGKATGDVVLDLASGQSGDAARDRKMHGEVLQTDQFPKAIFTAERVTGRLGAQGTSELDVAGSIAIHGASHAMTLHVDMTRSADGYIAHTQFNVPYADWGIKNPSTFILHVNGSVDLDIHAAATATTT